MILFYGEGRLGNQLFQYYALAAIARPGERIVAFGLEDLGNCVHLTGPRVVAIRTTLWVKRAIKYLLLPLLLRPISRYGRIIGYGREEAEAMPLRISRGMLPRLTFVDGGYYQRPGGWAARFPATLASPTPSSSRAADEYLARNCPPGTVPAFVHVRRGDYIHHAFGREGNLALPTAYYEAAIAHIRGRIANPFFVFVTDDVAWVNSQFQDVLPRSVTSSDTCSDWAVLARCRAGVLSNSTFSLSAALHMADPALLVGPRFWMGFRQAQWNPMGIELDDPRLAYIEVPATAAPGAA